MPIESVDDLADQTAIEYGTMHGGSTMTFFQVRGHTQLCMSVLVKTTSSHTETWVPLGRCTFTDVTPLSPRSSSCLTYPNRQFYLFPACSSLQSFSILLLWEMRHSERRTLSSLITSRLDLKATECERNRVRRGETVKHGWEGRKGRHYPCLTLKLHLYWTINKSD